MLLVEDAVDVEPAVLLAVAVEVTVEVRVAVSFSGDITLSKT